MHILEPDNQWVGRGLPVSITPEEVLEAQYVRLQFDLKTCWAEIIEILPEGIFLARLIDDESIQFFCGMEHISGCHSFDAATN
jgi:hypothetical protein